MQNNPNFRVETDNEFYKFFVYFAENVNVKYNCVVVSVHPDYTNERSRTDVLYVPCYCKDNDCESIVFCPETPNTNDHENTINIDKFLFSSSEDLLKEILRLGNIKKCFIHG